MGSESEKLWWTTARRKPHMWPALLAAVLVLATTAGVAGLAMAGQQDKAQVTVPRVRATATDPG